MAYFRVAGTPGGAGWADAVRAAAIAHKPDAVLEGPLYVTTVFWLPRPQRVLEDDACHWHDGRPDVDALLRQAIDAMAACGWWRTPGQIAELSARKFYGRRDPDTGSLFAGASISIERIIDKFGLGEF